MRLGVCEYSDTPNLDRTLAPRAEVCLRETVFTGANHNYSLPARTSRLALRYS